MQPGQTQGAQQQQRPGQGPGPAPPGAPGTGPNQQQQQQQLQLPPQAPYGVPEPNPVLQRTNSGQMPVFSGAAGQQGGMGLFSATGSSQGVGSVPLTPQFDTNNFPALGDVGTWRGGVGVTGDTAVPAAAGTEKKEFHVANEDFPALPLSGIGGTSGQKPEMGQMPFMTGGAAPGTHGNGSAKATDLKANEDQWAAQLALVKQQVAQALKEGKGKGKAAAPAAATAAADTAAAAAASTSSKFGLMGLLDVIRMTDRDLNSLMLGSDLTTYGLNLNSTDSLYSSFCSPFADQVASAEPKFATPQCYLMNPPNLKMEHMRKFQLETLFYMFYALPQDVLQAHSAQELMRREWRYHVELKIWLKQRTPQEVMATQGADGQAPVAFIFFDAGSWEARPFNSAFRGTLQQGFLSEDDIKFSA